MRVENRRYVELHEITFGIDCALRLTRRRRRPEMMNGNTALPRPLPAIMVPNTNPRRAENHSNMRVAQGRSTSDAKG